MSIKSKILDYLYENNKNFFVKKMKNYLEEFETKRVREMELEEIYEDNKSFFENKLVESFTGFIPKDISEPALKIFEDHAELFQRWILWQSFYINNRALNDSALLEKYKGMMIYLKVLFLMAEVNKKKSKPVKAPINSTPEPSFLDKAMAAVDEFKNKYGKTEVQADKSETVEN